MEKQLHNIGDYFVCDLPSIGPACVLKVVAHTCLGAFWGEIVWCDFSFDYDNDIVYLIDTEHSMKRITTQQFVEIKLCKLPSHK